jgi:hypothetical protein
VGYETESLKLSRLFSKLYVEYGVPLLSSFSILFVYVDYMQGLGTGPGTQMLQSTSDTRLASRLKMVVERNKTCHYHNMTSNKQYMRLQCS